MSWLVQNLKIIIFLLHYVCVVVVDGYWTPWSNWDTCSVSCGGGSRSRERECIKPRHGGKPCEGNSSDGEECNTQHCPSRSIQKLPCSKTAIYAPVCYH